MIKGKLESFWETGTEGVIWSLYMDGKEGYDALYTIKEGDYIKIYDEEDKLMYEGDIIEDRFSNWFSYPMNPILGQQAAGCYLVHWVQADVSPDTWCHWFNRTLRAEITESFLEKEKIKLVKNSIINKYYQDRVFSDVILEKSKLQFDPKNPKHWGEEGDSVVASLLFSAEKRYQIFDDKYYTMIILQNTKDYDQEIVAESIEPKLFTELNLIEEQDIFDKVNKYKDFQKNVVSKDYKRHFAIMFGSIEDEDYLRKLDNLSKDYNICKEKMGKDLLNKIKYIPSYKIEDTIFKLVCFDKETTQLVK